MMLITAGQLDRRITLQQKSVTQDPNYGTEVITWVTYGTARMPAQVQDVLPGKSETLEQGLRQARRPARVRLRYLAGITSDMRVVLHGSIDRTMQIIAGPAELGRREGIELMCEEYSTTSGAQ